MTFEELVEQKVMEKVAEYFAQGNTAKIMRPLLDKIKNGGISEDRAQRFIKTVDSSAAKLRSTKSWNAYDAAKTREDAAEEARAAIVQQHFGRTINPSNNVDAYIYSDVIPGGTSMPHVTNKSYTKSMRQLYRRNAKDAYKAKVERDEDAMAESVLSEFRHKGI